MNVTAETDRAEHRFWVLAGRAPGAWQPQGVDDALVVLDRIARYCAFNCRPNEVSCGETDCEVWELEVVAADFVARRSFDAEA